MNNNQINQGVNNQLNYKKYDRRKILDEARNLDDFESVAAYYCSKLYPKEKRVQRARKFLREFDACQWDGKLQQLIWMINADVRKEQLSISSEDILAALEAEGWLI
jgi:hypothetical protein